MAADQPPRPDAGSGDGGDRQPQIVVDDPEDFAKTRQLRAIFDARDDYIDARRKANRASEDGEIGFRRKNQWIFRYMQDFAMAIEPLLKSYDTGREIWTERTYGIDNSFTDKSNLKSFSEAIDYCKDIARDVQSVQNAQALADDAKTAKAIKLLDRLPSEDDGPDHPAFGTGSLGYWSTDNKYIKDGIKDEFRVFATSWGWKTIGVESLVRGTPRLAYKKRGPKNQFDTTAPPQQVSDSVFRDLQDFIREIGLGVQFDEHQQTKIDDDLLDEVDTWRQENIN